MVHWYRCQSSQWTSPPWFPITVRRNEHRYLPASRVVSSHTKGLAMCVGGPQVPRYQLRVSVWRRKGTGRPLLLIQHPRAEARGFAGRMLSDSYPGSTTVPRCISGPCNRHVAACAFCTLQRCGNHVSYIKPSSQLTDCGPHLFRLGNSQTGQLPIGTLQPYMGAGFEPDACCDGREQ